ncbi:DUF4240 domain-containing protein [Nonomuraea wenchangensis]|uniref:DUF4240 domain-containing protein n=1 Tax=Nonomuraea wenchangensis TaxID=568860 RepID=A0A1I0LB14_9ACTN|nr:DUF4240 domain-containing protein [Nonomuraea wenchangensis]SEU36996.1 Protein of unknown function [Nonomuraea wenchangensis]
MDVDEFWDLIERSGRETDTRSTRVAWLVDELSRRPVEEIIDYDVWWITTHNRGCTTDLYAAYRCVFGSGSLDGFEYFVSWLISLGRETFEAVADCPDRLIKQPQVLHLLELEESYNNALKPRPQDPEQMREELPEFESLAYAPYDAYERVSGKDSDTLVDAVAARGISGGFSLNPALGSVPHGERWDLDDESELARRLPRIARFRDR